MKLRINEKYLFFFICSIGILLRYYNHSFDDLWYDEVISFWIANPEFTTQESLANHSLIEVNSITYYLILKFFFTIFGYSVENGRLLSVIFGLLSIFSISYLHWLISRNSSYLFAAFLFSLNIFLISFSQEVRVYSLLVFFSALSLIFFFKVLDKNKNFFYLLGFNLSSLVLVSLHPFSLIIFFSYCLYLTLLFIKLKKFNIYLILSILLSFISAFFIYYYSFLLAAKGTGEYFWIVNPDLGFYSNFYFSSFFGSRFMGLVFLITFLFLIYFNYKKLLNIKPITLFVIIIFLSYILPITFGYLFKPILVSRYIIFVLIPIISFISLTIFEIKNKFKNYLIFFLVLITIGNHFTEQTVKQFFGNRIVAKPEYTSAVKYINESKYKNYILKVEKMKNNEASISAISNYISTINNENSFNVKMISLSDIDKETFFWHLCFQDINGKNCLITRKIDSFQVIKEKNFNNINLKLVEVY